MKEVVYEVPCRDCECSYIGEIGRNLQKRLTEHKAAVRRGDRNNGIAVHASDHDHRVDWEAARVLEQEPRYWKRRTLEAIHIMRHGNTTNLDCMQANAKLNLDSFLDSVINRSHILHITSPSNYTSLFIPVLYVLESLQLMKVYGPKRPVFVRLFCYNTLTNLLSILQYIAISLYDNSNIHWKLDSWC